MRMGRVLTSTHSALRQRSQHASGNRCAFGSRERCGSAGAVAGTPCATCCAKNVQHATPLRATYNLPQYGQQCGCRHGQHGMAPQGRDAPRTLPLVSDAPSLSVGLSMLCIAYCRHAQCRPTHVSFGSLGMTAARACACALGRTARTRPLRRRSCRSTTSRGITPTRPRRSSTRR